MSHQNLYSSPNVASLIKQRAKEQKATIKEMLSDVGLGINTLSNMNHGKAIASDSLACIADYLNCSVDYLLGRTDNPEINGSVSVVNNGTGSVGFNHGTVTVNGVSEECAELVRIYASLDIRQRVRLLNMAIEVADGQTE